MMVRVEFTVRPRRATPEEPTAKPMPKAVGMVPLLSAETERIASATVVMPALSMASAVTVVTGEGVSVSCRRNRVPVTMMPSTSVEAEALAGADCAAAMVGALRMPRQSAGAMSAD
jgi:arginine/lysine/ornithine decarboxylase